MIDQMIRVLKNIVYSFPIQLLVLHFKKNQILLLCWVLLFMVITGNFGESLGVPYLFLDPEYLNEVSFKSFFIMGLVLAGFSVAFHITCYIIDGYRFSFLGQLPKPFSRFSLNNSIIPLGFLITYVILIINFQLHDEFASTKGIILNISGLLSGYLFMNLALYLYFRATNKDIFKYVVCKVDEKIKRNVKVTRGKAMAKLEAARRKQVRVDHYLDLRLKFKNVPKDQGFYDKSTIIQVFDQNHLNLVIIELLVFVLLMVLGIFRDHDIFQIPAAASGILFLTIFVMFTGAFSYWFRGWAITVLIIMLISLNFIIKEEILKRDYKAFGINYNSEKADYTLSRLKEINTPLHYNEDKNNTLNILRKWRSKFPKTMNPKMVFICASGGGQRASLWTMKVLQTADSLTGGNLMKNSILITGASGGLIGASYYRELYLRKMKGEHINLYQYKYLENISNDNLNPIIFSLLVNDLLVNFQNFEYAGMKYPKDRGYSFEHQLNKNTEYILDKPLSSYQAPEKEAMIPMMVIAPTIMNDGRKLFISPHRITFMNTGIAKRTGTFQTEIEGIDFNRFFMGQDAGNLRFLSALRMAATFPYITPSVTLPSDPPMKIMDAGVTDNFGISDAIRFLYAFKDWMAQNTSGVIILSIRDSLKDGPILQNENMSLIDKFSTPISSIYLNFENIQDFNNDNKIQFAQSWFKNDLYRIDLQYIPQKNGDNKRIRASLNWRLTSREKKNIISSIHSKSNQTSLQQLVNLIESEEDFISERK